MIRMRVAEHDRVDVLGLDAGGLQVEQEPAVSGPKALVLPVPVSNKAQALAGIDHQGVLLELAHCRSAGSCQSSTLMKSLLAHADEDVAARLAELKRPVRHHGGLEAADLKSIEGRCLRVRHRRLGMRGAGQRPAQSDRGRDRHAIEKLTARRAGWK